jgi:hypothetical protein
LIEEGPEVTSLGFFAVRGPIIAHQPARCGDAPTGQQLAQTTTRAVRHEDVDPTSTSLELIGTTTGRISPASVALGHDENS